MFNIRNLQECFLTVVASVLHRSSVCIIVLSNEF